MSGISFGELAENPHLVLASLRADRPVAWLDELGGWMITSHALCTRVLTDSATFTVDDERFSTRRVVGPSMLSLDGLEHGRHRSAFAPDYRRRQVYEQIEGGLRDLVASHIGQIAPAGEADLRSALATPIATEVMRGVLGLGDVSAEPLTEWNAALTSAIDDVTEGENVPSRGSEAFADLEEAVGLAVGQGSLKVTFERGDLDVGEIASNIAVLLIGGIVTSDGAISIALRHLLDRPALLEGIREDPGLVDRFVEESLRFEPAAAFLDRYATKDIDLGSQSVRSGDLVRVSISAANRDPDVFADPDRFDIWRSNVNDHLTFARGPHSCLGIHLARLEIRTVVAALVEMLPNLRAGPGDPPPPRGMIFRAPEKVPAIWGEDSATLS